MCEPTVENTGVDDVILRRREGRRAEARPLSPDFARGTEEARSAEIRKQSSETAEHNRERG